MMSEEKFTKVPHVPRGRAFLDSRDMIRNPVEVFERYRARLGPTFTFHFGGAKRAIVSADPEFIQEVLRGKRDNYHKSDIQVERMVEFQGKGLVNSHGETWLRQRRLVGRGFRPNRLASLLPIQQEVLAAMMDRFDHAARQGPVDVYQQMVMLTLCLVGKSIFGRSMSETELTQIGHTISTIQAFIVRQIVQPYKIPWFRISGQSARHQRLREAGDKMVLEHIRARREAGCGETDLLRLLLETPYHDTGEPMTEDQVMVESIQLMVAGNETSSIGLAWVFYLLAKHPQYIRSIREEVTSVLGDGPIDFAGLHELKLTLRVIDEALRLYPPFWMIDRVALRDDDLCGIQIPADTMVIPYIYGTHRNSTHWKNSDAFDPTRFEPGRRKGASPFSYLPFGGGPRSCIGKNMALVQMLLIVVTFVRKYDFEMVSEAPVGIRPMMLLRPEGPIVMRFRPWDN